MAAIKITHLHKRFGDFVAVRDSTLRFDDGRFVVLLGPSGCGKTTTLRMLAGLEFPTSGEIRLDDADVTYRRPRERDIAMVFQLFALYPHMGVRDNLEFPLREHGMADRAARSAALEKALRDVGLWEEVKDRLASPAMALSGGQQQRLCIARALALRPEVLLMDEPCSALDPIASGVIMNLVARLNASLGLTSIIVTHHVHETLPIADHAIVIANGRIVFSGTPAALQASTDPLVLQFLRGEPDGPIPFDARPFDARPFGARPSDGTARAAMESA